MRFFGRFTHMNPRGSTSQLIFFPWWMISPSTWHLGSAATLEEININDLQIIYDHEEIIIMVINMLFDIMMMIYYDK